jgi:hypothetical protein
VERTGWDRLVSVWPTVREIALLALGAWWGYLTVRDPGPVDWGNVSLTAGCLGIGLAWRKDERRQDLVSQNGRVATVPERSPSG